MKTSISNAISNNGFNEATRSAIISLYSRINQNSPATAAYELTQYCIRNKLVAARKPLSGQRLKDWAKNGCVPLWAATGAWQYLTQELNYTPTLKKDARVMAAAKKGVLGQV